MPKSISCLLIAGNLISTWRRKTTGALAALFLLLLPATLPAQTLTVKDELQLWLRADEGVTADANGAVTAWTDGSGKGNNATQSDAAAAPRLVPDAINSKPAVRIDGVND